MKRTLPLILLAAMSVSAASCGENSGTQPTVDTVSPADSVTTAPEYDYPVLDCGGKDFNILNCSNTWSMYYYLDFEEMTGDALNDAIYTRNRDMEDRYKFKLNITEVPNTEAAAKIKTSVSAGDDEYQAVYCPANYSAALITEGFFYNLFDVPEFQLSEKWWDQAVISESSIGNGDAIYYAASDFQLFGFEGTWCTYFNENMLEDHKLEKPYQLVRDGKWTLDVLMTYIKSAGNLNGDESFDFKVDGNAVYGMASSYAYPTALIIASGERYIKKDDSGYPKFALETDRFYTLADKIATLCASKGDYISRNNAGADHYEEIFRARRAMFLGAELKACSKFRDFDDTFGIVPNPKFDESQKSYYQESYYSNMSKATYLLAVPATNPEPDKAGIILDAFSYVSYRDILPIYYDITLSQKGLRNDESVEMLGIIRDSRYCDVGDAYGWTSSIQDTVRKTLDKGSADIASAIAAEKSNIEERIKKTMDLLTK